MKERDIKKYFCSKCSNTLFLDKEKLITCECVNFKKIIEKYYEANIPRKYFDITFDSLKQEKIISEENIKIIERYINKRDFFYEKGIGLYLWGSTGNGKTSIGICILKEMLKNGYSVYFEQMSRLVSNLYYYLKNSEESKKYSNKICTSDFLMLDDLDKEYVSDSGFVQAKIDEIFRTRIYNELPTLTTSNKNITNLKTKSYTDSILSILKESLFVIEFSSKIDYRTKISSTIKQYFGV